MRFLSSLERRFGKYAIKRLTVYIIMTYAAGYVLSIMSRFSAYSGIFSFLTLSPSLIMHGQVWRLVSWFLIPPSSLSIFTIIMLIFYYQLGTVLEKTWGDFLYNLYVFFGIIMTIAGAFILYAITGVDFGVLFSTYYVSLSIFLGFALTFPDQRILFMFVIPLKIKYLALIDIAYLVYQIVRYAMVGLGWPVVTMIVCSLANTILFFFLTRKYKRISPGTRRTQNNYRRAMQGRRSYGASSGRPYGGYAGNTGGRSSRTGQSGQDRISRHKCAVCGRTEWDDPNLEFRFCSKCNGNYEYCQDHLFTHKHVE